MEAVWRESEGGVTNGPNNSPATLKLKHRAVLFDRLAIGWSHYLANGYWQLNLGTCLSVCHLHPNINHADTYRHTHRPTKTHTQTPSNTWIDYELYELPSEWRVTFRITIYELLILIQDSNWYLVTLTELVGRFALEFCNDRSLTRGLYIFPIFQRCICK